MVRCVFQKKIILIITVLFLSHLIFIDIYPAHGYSCSSREGRSMTYRTDFHIIKQNGDDLTHGFVYVYPKTELKNSAQHFNRGDSNGFYMATVQVCVPRNTKVPKFIRATCVIKGPWDGKTYEIKKMNVKLYPDAGWDTIKHPVILTKKNNTNQNQKINKHYKIKKGNGEINGTYSCKNGSEITIIVRADGSWAISNKRFQLGGGGGGFKAAEKAAKRLCK